MRLSREGNPLSELVGIPRDLGTELHLEMGDLGPLGPQVHPSAGPRIT